MLTKYWSSSQRPGNPKGKEGGAYKTGSNHRRSDVRWLVLARPDSDVACVRSVSCDSVHNTEALALGGVCRALQPAQKHSSFKVGCLKSFGATTVVVPVAAE